MLENRRAARCEDSGPVTFRVGDCEAEGTLVNLSATGALFRFSTDVPLGTETVGQPMVFTSWCDVGALLRPEGIVIRYFETPEGKHLAVRYLPD